MKKIDWYILRKYLGTFIFIIILLNSITVIIDISEKIDAFLEPGLPISTIIFQYYVYFIPYISAILAPFFALIAVIFFTSQLADRSEIVAILNSGTSFYRFLYPYLLGAFIISGSLFLASNFFLPKFNKNRVAFESKYVYKYENQISYNFHRQIEPGVFIYMEDYRPAEKKGRNFSMEYFQNGELKYKMRAENITWDSIQKKWTIANYVIREKKSDQTDVITEGKLMDTTYAFTPDNFNFNSSAKEEMTTPELRDYIAKLYKQGANFIEFYEVELYRRSAIPFSIFIMTLIGVSVASRKMRGGLGWHLVLGIALSASYEILMKFSVTFATNSTLSPMIGVWIPNFLYTIIAIYLIWKAPK